MTDTTAPETPFVYWRVDRNTPGRVQSWFIYCTNFVEPDDKRDKDHKSLVGQEHTREDVERKIADPAFIKFCRGFTRRAEMPRFLVTKW